MDLEEINARKKKLFLKVVCDFIVTLFFFMHRVS
jgi:hypothetical protein